MLNSSSERELTDEEKSEQFIREMIAQNPGDYEQMPSETYAELIKA